MQKNADQLAQELALRLLNLNAQKKETEKEIENAKSELTALCNSVYFDKFEDDKWVLPEAQVSINLVKNPMKFVDVRTGDGLTPTQRANIAMQLSDKYCTVDLNTKEIQLSQEVDKSLKKVLEINNAGIIQDTRYDVKKTKDK